MSTGNVEVSLTALRVADLAVAQRFWVDGCGLVQRTSFSTDSFDAVIIGGHDEGSAGIELVCERDGGAVVAGTAFWKLVLSSSDVAARMALAVQCGGAEVLPAQQFEQYGGLTIGIVRSPDGHLVEFIDRSTSSTGA